jgi:glycosyltransferase involved in cell wall biosynthesis
VLKAADKVIFVSNGIRELTLNKFKFNYKSYVISNGYDNDDFLNLNKSLLIDTNNINISYIGTMFGPQANHKLIEGINTFSKKLNSNSPIKFNFIGEFEFKILQAINANNLIRLINKISHSEALNLMFTSQILILVLPNDFEGKIAYSGKFFEYIKIGKPILGIVPDGEVAEIIKKYNLGEIANPDDIIEIKNKINKIIENINSYTKLPVEELYKYSREAQTEYLINLIHE